MIYTTLNRIREHHPCPEGWMKLLTYLHKVVADDEPVALLTILESNGLYDALWCLRAVSDFEKENRLFAVFCARRVQHLMRDQRSITALDVSERHANGEATEKELITARAGAWVAMKSVLAPRGAIYTAWAATWVPAGAWSVAVEARAAMEMEAMGSMEAVQSFREVELKAQTEEFIRIVS